MEKDDSFFLGAIEEVSCGVSQGDSRERLYRIKGLIEEWRKAEFEARRRRVGATTPTRKPPGWRVPIE